MTHRLLGAALVVPLAFLIALPVARPNAATRKSDIDLSLEQDIRVVPTTAESAAQLAGLRAKIQHIVFIVKENRSFDNYFGTFPGADGATTGVISTGEEVELGHSPDQTPRDLGHEWEDTHLAMNGGKMDRFDLVRAATSTATS